eukprot:s169_g13.t1
MHIFPSFSVVNSTCSNIFSGETHIFRYFPPFFPVKSTLPATVTTVNVRRSPGDSKGSIIRRRGLLARQLGDGAPASEPHAAQPKVTNCKATVSLASLPLAMRRSTRSIPRPRRAIMWHDELDALAPITKKVYLDVAGGDFQGRIVLGLYADLVPKTCENFCALCSGEKGFSYKGSCFHRIFFDFMVQGGRLEGNNESIYGGRFEDEESGNEQGLNLYHERPGLVGMANDGPDSNGSQFYITTAKTVAWVHDWCGGRHFCVGTHFMKNS